MCTFKKGSPSPTLVFSLFGHCHFQSRRFQQPSSSPLLQQRSSPHPRPSGISALSSGSFIVRPYSEVCDAFIFAGFISVYLCLFNPGYLALSALFPEETSFLCGIGVFRYQIQTLLYPRDLLDSSFTNLVTKEASLLLRSGLRNGKL